MAKIAFCFLLSTILLTTACATRPKVASRTQSYSKKNDLADHRAKQSEESLQYRKEKAQVMASLSKLNGSTAGKNDATLYFEIVEYYKVGKLTKLNQNLRALLNRYPHSPYADNALLLSGQLSLHKEDYVSALQQFNRILYSYPNGSKAVTALLSKGLAYKRMNLGKEARSVFAKVNAKYPGSPEAVRAQRELASTQQFGSTTRM